MPDDIQSFLRRSRTRSLTGVMVLLAVAAAAAGVAARIQLVPAADTGRARDGGQGSPPASGPGPPSAFLAVAKNGGQVELTWSGPAGGDVTGYTIYRDGALLKLVSPILSSYVDITVQPERRYHYEIESVGPDGRSSRTVIAGVRTPAPPPVALAQVTGYYFFDGQVTSVNSSNWPRGQPLQTYWQFFPLCTGWTACDVTTYGDGEEEATLTRSGASYSGRLVRRRHIECGPARADEIDTVRFEVTSGEFFKGVWTANRLRGTIRKKLRAGHGCPGDSAVIEFEGTWDGL